MNKLSNLWENITIFYEAALDNPKKSVTLIVVLVTMVFIAYKMVSRVPDIWSCYYQASWSQDVPSDLWRHNLVTNECQYYNGARWIPLDKVIDVGADGSVDEIDL